MNYYLSKYVGKYRLKAEIDYDTNDYPRDKKTNELIDNQDIYIKCANNIRVYHYGGRILEVYIPSIGKGRNIVKKIYADLINSTNVSVDDVDIQRKDGKEIKREKIEIKDTDLFEEELRNGDNVIFGVLETDEEVLFKIRDKDFSKITNIIKPQESGASISPFSSKNLPKKKNILSVTQIKEYKEITSKVPKDDLLKISQINNHFLSDIMCKKLRISTKDAKNEMKKELLKLVDYISFKGFWGEYIQYLQHEVDLIL